MPNTKNAIGYPTEDGGFEEMGNTAPKVNMNADDISYDNSQSGASATNVQAAVDEAFSDLSELKHTVLKTASADGVKTTAQLLNELVPTLNSLSADVIEHTRIILNDNNMGLKYYFYPNHINKNVNIYIFANTNGNTAASTPASVLGFLYLQSGSCKRVDDTFATTNSRTDLSSYVMSSSWDFTLVLN